MMEHVDDLTVHYEEDGKTLVEELDKQILSKGSWSTVIFKYRDWDRRKEEMGPVKFTIRRYQKRNGAYRQQAKFNISSEKQATGIIDALQNWLAQS
jgi:hypothetical protein